MKPILQKILPFDPWSNPQLMRLPGILPLKSEDWIDVDDAYGAQMELRKELLTSRQADVYQVQEQANEVALEALEYVLSALKLRSDFQVFQSSVIRPDGVEITVDPDNPLLIVAHLLQEDICLMQLVDDQYILTGANLCFPASWTLLEKIGKPMDRIHAPVTEYTDDIERRVRRLFDAIRPEQPLWRVNINQYEKPDLYIPALEDAPRQKPNAKAAYTRIERQCLLRLPVSRAIVFSIHTYVVATENITQNLR